MTKEKKAQWIAHIWSVVGLVIWVGIGLLYPRIQGIVVVMLLFAVPATIYNIIREALSKDPVCATPSTLESIMYGTDVHGKS